MALWSLFVEVGTIEHYSTQVTAKTPNEAIGKFLAGTSLKQLLARLVDEGWPPSFSAKDVFLLIPMDGLVNMYLCQLGKRGKYVSITLARTVSRTQA